MAAVEKHRVPEGYAPPGLKKNAHHKLENKPNYLNTQCVAVLFPHHHVRHSPIIRVLEDSIENPTSKQKKKILISNPNFESINLTKIDSTDADSNLYANS